MKKKWIVIALAACAIVLAGCKVVSEPEPVAVESVTLDATPLTLAPGDTRKLTATVKPENADDKIVKWSSSDTSVVMVDSDGTVVAIKVGTAAITAQAGGKSATCTVIINAANVQPDSVAVESVTLNAETLTIELGKTRTLTATVTPDNADDKTVIWSSSNTAVATVVDGAVTAVAEGTAVITAQAGEKTATCAITVKLALVAVDGITLNTKTLALLPGETEKLVATITPSNADDKTVLWSSSDASIATVGNDGMVTAHKAGTATITAQAGDKETECVVTVNPQSNNTAHVHNYSGGLCTVCGFQKPFMLDATIDDSGVLTDYHGAEATVTIPDGVIGIGGGAFENCGSLKKVVIPGSVTAIGSQAFKGCSNLNTLEISTGLTGIGSYAFDGCTSLRNVSIPDSVTSIGDYAFSGCTKLSSVTIPASVTSIGEKAFTGCESLSVTYSGTLAQWCVLEFDYDFMSYAKSVMLTGENNLNLKTATTLTIPNGVTSIGYCAFARCTSLASVIIPTSVTKISNNAFYECENLENVQYNGTLTQWCSLDGNGGIMLYAKHVNMSDGTDLNSSDKLVIPDGVTSIGNGIFYECTGFSSVTIPASVKSIGGVSFSGCTTLKSVTIPNSVTSIGLGAFARCTGLTSVIVSGSVASIEMMTFYSCTSLTDVTIPDGVTSIGQQAFSGCTSLATLTYKGTKAQWMAITKGDYWDLGTGNYTIHCTDGKLDKNGNDVE